MKSQSVFGSRVAGFWQNHSRCESAHTRLCPQTLRCNRPTEFVTDCTDVYTSTDLQLERRPVVTQNGAVSHTAHAHTRPSSQHEMQKALQRELDRGGSGH